MVRRAKGKHQARQQPSPPPPPQKPQNHAPPVAVVADVNVKDTGIDRVEQRELENEEDELEDVLSISWFVVSVG